MEESAVADKTRGKAGGYYTKQTHSSHDSTIAGLSNIQAKIYGELDKQELRIADKQQPLPKKDKLKDTKQSLEKIRAEKQRLKANLARLAKSEAELKKNFVGMNPQDALKKQKSSFTLSDMRLIKKLQKSYKDFQKEITHKDQTIAKEHYELKQQEKERQRQRLLEEKEARKKQAERWLEEKNQQKQDNQSRLGQSMRSNTSHHSSADALYMRMDKLWKERQNEQMRKLQQLKGQLKKQKRADFQEIKEHELKHEQLYRNKQQERERRMKELADENSMRLKSMTPPSKFFQVWRDQQEKERREQQRKQEVPWVKSQKQQEYGRIVKRELLPKIKCKQNQTVEIVEQTCARQGLNHHEQYLKGNEYLAKAKELIGHEPAKAAAPLRELVKVGMSKYPNYLVRTSNHESQEERVMKMLKDKNKSMLQVIENTRHLARKLDENAQRDPKRILQSIQTKLNIINQLNE